MTSASSNAGSRSGALRIGDFEVNMAEELGKGGFGVVYKGYNIHSRTPVAAKSIKLDGDTVGQTAIQEIKNMQHVSSPYLARLVDFSFGQNAFWLFVEFCNKGDLQNYMVTENPPEPVLAFFMTHMATAVAYLHEKATVHRDIKPANILICFVDGDKYPIAKISDFGLAKVADAASGGMSPAASLQFSTRGGTVVFMAPELFDFKAKCDKSVDVFALGVTFLAMVCYKKGQKHLIPAEDPSSLVPIGEEMYNMSRYGQQEKAKVYNQEIVPIKGGKTEKQVRELVRKMISFDSNARLSSSFVQQKVQNIYDELKDKMPPPPPRAANSGSPTAVNRKVTPAAGAGSSSSSESSEPIPEGFKNLKDSIHGAVDRRRKRHPSAVASEVDMDDAPLVDLLQMLLRPDHDAAAVKEKYGFSAGDTVQVRSDLSIDRVKILQDHHGSWNDKMRSCLGKNGVVEKIVLGVVRVKFSDGKLWSFNPNLLRKVDQSKDKLSRYDIVQVEVDVKKIEERQVGHGGWNDSMSICIGNRGIVNRIDEDGDAIVECIGSKQSYIFNPANLQRMDTSNERILEGDTVLVMDNADALKQLQTKEHGGWNSEMRDLVGSAAEVVSLKTGSAQVRTPAGKMWWLNPAALSRMWGKQDRVKHHGVLCDGCKQAPITGLRFKCKVCENYDICERCLQRKVHNQEHGLLQFRKSQNPSPENSGTLREDPNQQLVQKIGELGARFGALLAQEMMAQSGFEPGDLVQIDSNLERVMRRQEGHGNWVSGMKDTLGKLGIVISHHAAQNRTNVEVDGRKWIFNSKSLSKVASKDEVLKLVRKL